VKGLRLRKGVYHIDKTVNGIRVYKTTWTCDRAAAEAILAREVARVQAAFAHSEWIEHVEAMEQDWDSWLNRTYRKVRYRAKKAGRSFKLSRGDLKTLLIESNGACALTGIPFSNDRMGKSRMPPFGLSIDRIKSVDGYHLGNVRLVCMAVNLAMREWGEDVLFRIGYAVALKNLSEHVGAHNSARQNHGKAIVDKWAK
jgi:hypothetical protein